MTIPDLAGHEGHDIETKQLTTTTTHPDNGIIPRPDIAATSLYPILARISQFELHANLLDLLQKGLSGQEGPINIVVVGPGPEVLPFADHLATVTGLVNGGNLILLDYNREICDRIPGYLEQKGFGRGFRIERCRDREIPDLRTVRNTVLVMEWDLRDGFPFPAASIDAIDMTVSLHHVTRYASDVALLFRQAATVLTDGGVLHIGEGNVDMKHSERKIRQLVGDLCTCGAAGVLVSDARYGDAAPLQWSVGDGENTTMHISADGMIGIDAANGALFAHCLAGAGYKQLYVSENLVVLPLIDHAMEKDFQEMIMPVRVYYGAISELCLRSLDPALHEEFFRVLYKEQSDAERGVVEYYSAPSLLRDSLVAAGFTVDAMRFTENGPFVNILAVKKR